MSRFLAILALLFAPAAWGHEFEADRIEVMDANAEVLDGDTSTLFVQFTVANGGATTKLLGFETTRGKIGDWVEVRRFFGQESVKVLETKTIRTRTLYEMHRPDGYLVITDVDPKVYTCDFGYLLLHLLFEDGEGIDVAVWIDPLYTQICN